MTIVVWVLAILAILPHLGVNVAPLLASAGVVGVALGFGAQSLVKDFLSGIFLLMEDQYGVGDYVMLGKAEGTVEDVSLRTTTLRDIDGTLWFVRNGEIMSVGNSSQGFSVARIDVPVGLKNDVATVREAALDATNEAAKASDISRVLLGDVVIDGVSKIAIDHMDIRLRVDTLPGEQWFVKRRLFEAVLAGLLERGVEPAYHALLAGRSQQEQETSAEE